MRTVVEAVQAAQPTSTVAVWCDDEHRLGLKPVLRRVWTPRRQAPVALVQPRYEWLYVLAFVQPESGASFWLLLPRLNTALFSLALAEFAQALGIGPTNQVVGVLDQAGWHSSPPVVVPVGVTMVPLPAYSPELQPAERLWPLVDHAIANQVFASLDALMDRLSERCRTLAALPALIAGHTGFHWWPRLLPTTAQ